VIDGTGAAAPDLVVSDPMSYERRTIMRNALLAIACAVAIAALPAGARADQPVDPGCFGSYHALAAHVLGGNGEMIRSNCAVRAGRDGASLGRDFNPPLREAVC
jgi:hypothetical protein